MKTFQTTNIIAPIISVGTYWGRFGYESLWEDEEQKEHEEGRYVCDDYSHMKLGEALVEEANKVFAHVEPFKDVGVSFIRATAFGSPKEYNFGDDWLDLEFVVEDDFLDRAERKIFDPKYEKRFEKYIEDNWRSWDGFISSMPADSLADMHEVFRQLREDDCGIDDMRCFGSVIALLYEAARQDGELVADEDELYLSMTGQLLERFRGAYSLSDFCTILDADEVYGKFPEAKALLDDIAAARARLAEQYRKYCETGVPEEAKASQAKYVEERGEAFAAYEADVKSVIEQYWPDEGVVSSRLADIRENWEAEP